MNEWLKKNYLYCILICFILGIVILLKTWFYLESFRDFLVFLASILIASSAYLIILIQNIIKKGENERKIREERILNLERVYEKVRNIVVFMEKGALKIIISSKLPSTPYEVSIGERIIELDRQKYSEYLKLLDCRLEDFRLYYSEDYVIDGINGTMEYKEEYIGNDLDKIKILLDDVENTFKEARNKIA